MVLSEGNNSQLRDAVLEPSRFILVFLKQEDKGPTIKAIYDFLKQQLSSNEETKMKVLEENFYVLMANPLNTSLDQEDLMKPAFLQYMLYIYEYHRQGLDNPRHYVSSQHLGSQPSSSLRSLFFGGWIRNNTAVFISDNIADIIRAYWGREQCFIHLKSTIFRKISFYIVVDRRRTLWDIIEFLHLTAFPGRTSVVPRVRLKLRFFCLKDIYPIKTETVEVTAEDIEEMQVDPNRWVEVPNDYKKYINIGDVEDRAMEWNQSDHIEIAVDFDKLKTDKEPHHFQAGIFTDPEVLCGRWYCYGSVYRYFRTRWMDCIQFDSSNEEPQRLQVGSIIDVADYHGDWHESLIRYIRFEDREEKDDYVTAHVYVHFIGCPIRSDFIATLQLLTKDSLIENMEEEGFLPRGMRTNGPPNGYDNYLMNPKHPINVEVDWKSLTGIDLKKLADVTVLMPRGTKLKIWNHIFDGHDQNGEIEHISRVLQACGIVFLGSKVM